MVSPGKKKSRLSLKSQKNCRNGHLEIKSFSDDLNSKNEKEEPTISGLVNLVNTCFINCILHVLASTPQFVKYVHYSHENIIDKRKEWDLSTTEKFILSLHQVFIELSKGLKKKGNKKEIEKCLKDFLEKLRKLDSTYEGHSQHDAHEFFCKLLEILHKISLPKIPSEINPSPREFLRSRKKRKELTSKCIIEDTQTLFFGTIKSVNRCHECEIDQHSFQKFLDISFTPNKHEVPDEPSSENEEDKIDLVRASFEVEDGSLSGDNKFWCNECLHYNEAKLNKFYEKLPPILTFHVKRFDFGVSSQKILSAINVPKSINPQCTSKLLENKQYGLYAVVVHSGISLSSGHFTCYIKQPESLHITQSQLKDCCYYKGHEHHWLFYDDDKVIPISEDEMDKLLSEDSSETVYLLFYYCK